MPIHIDGAPPNLPPRRWAQVAAIEHVSASVMRICLTGDDLEGFEMALPGGHVKLILPAAGQDRPAVPARYEGGVPVFAPGAVQPFLRTYTPLRFDPTRRTLDVEVLLHGEGMAADWARRLRIGDEVIVAGPRGGQLVPDADWYVVAADDTAIPAATQILTAIGARPRFVLFETRDDPPRSLLLTPQETPKWLPAEAGHPGHALEQAIRMLEFPAGRGYVWVACEADAMRRIRGHLIGERGLSPDQVVTRGYWKLGSVDHPDGDYGQDDPGHRS